MSFEWSRGQKNFQCSYTLYTGEVHWWCIWLIIIFFYILLKSHVSYTSKNVSQISRTKQLTDIAKRKKVQFQIISVIFVNNLQGGRRTGPVLWCTGTYSTPLSSFARVLSKKYGCPSWLQTTGGIPSSGAFAVFDQFLDFSNITCSSDLRIWIEIFKLMIRSYICVVFVINLWSVQKWGSFHNLTVPLYWRHARKVA